MYFGTMEIWKSIPGYEGKYQVSNEGGIRNVKVSPPRPLKPFDRRKYDTIGRGYMTVHLVNMTDSKYKNLMVHSLVMLAFIGPRPKDAVINHINGNPSDNRLSNLEYCTQSHNILEDFRNNRRSLVGERNTQAKLTEKQVLKIIKMYKTGKYTYRSLGEKFGVHFCGISNIFNGHCWSYLTGIEKRY